MPNKKSWKSYLGVAAIAFAIAMVLNPEIRALMLLADLMGFETFIILVAVQLRSFWPVLMPVTQRVSSVACKLATSIGVLALKAPEKFLPFGPLHILLSPLFVALSYGVQCPIRSANP